MTSADIREVHSTSHMTSWHSQFLRWIQMYCDFHRRAYFTWLPRGIWRSHCQRWLRSWQHWLWDDLSHRCWRQCSSRSWVHSHSDQMSHCLFCGEKWGTAAAEISQNEFKFERRIFFFLLTLFWDTWPSSFHADSGWHYQWTVWRQSQEQESLLTVAVSHSPFWYWSKENAWLKKKILVIFTIRISQIWI